MNREDARCPKCGSKDVDRDEVDVGVGMVFGPWGCAACHWSEWPEYDLSDGRDPKTDAGVIDSRGGLTPIRRQEPSHG